MITRNQRNISELILEIQQERNVDLRDTRHMWIWVTVSVIVRFSQVRADKGYWEEVGGG